MQGKEWEAHKAELAPLSSHHAGLLAAYEADRAKLSELEAEAQAVLDEATALMADADRRALALAEVRLHSKPALSLGKCLSCSIVQRSRFVCISLACIQG